MEETKKEINLILTREKLNIDQITMACAKARAEKTRALFLSEVVNLNPVNFPPNIDWIWTEDICSIGRIAFNLDKNSEEKFRIIGNDKEVKCWGLFKDNGKLKENIDQEK